MSDVVFSTKTGACEFSPCKKYRYSLWRRWEMGNDVAADHSGPYGRRPGSFLAVIGLNPSTADETQNDPTITRCVDFATRWGFDALCMLNIFAFRSTDPNRLYSLVDPVGELNDAHLIQVTVNCHTNGGIVLAAWGNHGAIKGRGRIVTLLAGRIGIPLQCLGVTKTGQPKHPLYLKAELLPIQYP